jgi:holo-[acyl-carrier protein] synthase
MIVGVGVDLVDLARFERAITKTPELLTKIFSETEREGSVETLAGRFAAKEALVKAVGDPSGLLWHEVLVSKDSLGKPSLSTVGSTASFVAGRGINSLHLSISHDAGSAIAFVVAEA